jgi:hypothetical protein
MTLTIAVAKRQIEVHVLVIAVSALPSVVSKNCRTQAFCRGRVGKRAP